MKLQALAEKLGAELRGGDPEAEITGIARIEDAGAGDVSFVANPKYASHALTTKAGVLIVDPKFQELETPTLRVKDPYAAFAKALPLFYQPPAYKPGVHASAAVSATAKIGARAHIGAFVAIGDDVVIGDDAVILPHVVIYPGVQVGNRFFAHAHSVVREHCRLGDDVVLQNGAVIGADGFGFSKGTDGRYTKILQTGPAVLDDDVEVQANACVDRATLGETRIRRGAKIDNLVQVGHGSDVGENTMLCGQVGMAGSATIGKNVILAGQVGVGGHLTVGDGVIASGQTGITKDVEPGVYISGNPYVLTKEWLRSMAVFNRLPEVLRRVQALEGRDREQGNGETGNRVG